MTEIGNSLHKPQVIILSGKVNLKSVHKLDSIQVISVSIIVITNMESELLTAAC